MRTGHGKRKAGVRGKNTLVGNVDQVGGQACSK